MEANKITGYLNISQKAGYIIWGGDNLKNYNKKLYLVLVDTSAKKNTIKIVDKIKINKIPIIYVENLSNFVNKSNCKIIGIKNKGISEILIDLFNKRS